jgi:hypothetical protein
MRATTQALIVILVSIPMICAWQACWLGFFVVVWAIYRLGEKPAATLLLLLGLIFFGAYF